MILPMKRQKIILTALLFLVVVGFKPSIGARLLENGLFISPENPSAFDPNLNSVVQSTGTSSGSDPFKDPKDKTRLPCGEPSTLAFRFKEKGIMGYKTKEAPNSEEVVLNVLAKGTVPPSGPTQRGNNGIRSGVRHIQDQHRVSNKGILKSTPSPGAGH